MDKWNLIIDVVLCENCNNCVLSAKDEFVGNDFPGYTAPHPAHGPAVIRIERTVRGVAPRVDAAYLPVLCNHCDDAPCLAAGGASGAVRKRDDGIVIFDPVKARGRRDLVDVCPHDAVVWNDESQLPQTWFFDAHLLDAGAREPRCVAVCPTQAIEAVKTSDEAMQGRIHAEGLRHPVAGCKTRVHYRHLHRVDRCVVAGSVSGRVAGRIECLEGVRVMLAAATSDRDPATVTTDAFGDFRFDGLLPGSGSHRLTVVHPRFEPQTMAVTVREQSVDVGDIQLMAGALVSA